MHHCACSPTCNQDSFARGINEGDRFPVKDEVPGQESQGQVKAHEESRTGLQDTADGVRTKQEDYHPERGHTDTQDCPR